LIKTLKVTLLILIIISIIYFLLFQIINIQQIIYPKKYEQYVSKYAELYNVDELLIYSIIKAESNFDEKANSKAKAIGLMQLMENTATEISNEIDNIEIPQEQIYEPETNIKLGTYYFSVLMNKYNNIGLALAAYNAGMGRVDGWIKDGILKKDGSDLENIPFKETNLYVRKILYNYEKYKKNACSCITIVVCNLPQLGYVGLS